MSLFMLKREVSDLKSANKETTRVDYEQHPPTRDVTGNSFPNGAIHFRWQTSGKKWWIPSRTYLRMRYSLTKANGDPLELADGIAPNMDLQANMHQSAEFRMNEKVVSRISDYVPQVDALETRMAKSKSWLDGIGNALNYWQPDFATRQAEVCRDGTLVRENTGYSITSRTQLGFDAPDQQANRISALYTAANGRITFVQNGGADVPDVKTLFADGDRIRIRSVGGVDLEPPLEAEVLGVIDVTVIRVGENFLGSANLGAAENNDGRFDFDRLRPAVAPNSARRSIATESVWQPTLSIFKVAHAIPAGKFELVLNPQTASQYKKRVIESLIDKVPGVDFDFNIVDYYLYVATVEGERADDLTYLLDLEETRCQAVNLEGTSFQQKNFDISPSTYALTMAIQDQRAGNLTQYSAAKLKGGAQGDALGVTSDLLLSRYFIQYAGQSRPSPDSEGRVVPAVNGSNIDNTVQRYLDTQYYSGAVYDNGGPESLEDWQKRGPYYHHAWPRDGNDRSTRVSTHLQLSANDGNNARVLLFDHYRTVASVTVQDGRIVNVLSEMQ